MAQPEDLDSRVRRLEREVALLRERVAESAVNASAARTLASGADRDVSDVRAELRAHLRTLNALRQTQLEMQEGMRDMRADLRGEIAELRTEMRGSFSVVNTGMAQISALLANIARDDNG